MKIGVRIMPSWLHDEADLRFLQQIGVDCVDINLALLPSYLKGGRVDAAELSDLIAHLAGFDLVIERAANFGTLFKPIYLGLPEAEQAMEQIQQNIEVLGAHGVPIMAVPPFSPRSLATDNEDVSSYHKPRRDFPPFDLEHSGGYQTHRKHRGGYAHPRFDLDLFARADPLGVVKLDRQTLWQRLINLYKAIVPSAEQAGVRLTMHGNDPPIPEAWGQPQLVTRHDDFRRLFQEVPGAANGMTYCVGTRYESGEDIFEGIRHFGSQGRIFHVHFRNVEGTLTSQRSYSETLLDDGDINMGDVLRTLHEVGYQGAIDFDHILHLAGDTAHGRASVALAVGYIKGLINELPSRSLLKEEIPA